MSRWIQAHLDDKVVVPDEPVDLPVHAPLSVQVYEAVTASEQPSPEEIEQRLEGIRKWAGCYSAPVPSLESMRRENLYDERL